MIQTSPPASALDAPPAASPVPPWGTKERKKERRKERRKERKERKERKKEREKERKKGDVIT